MIDADIEQAELDAAGDAAAVARKLGRCTHGHTVCHRPTPFYTGQVGLRPGQQRCFDCATVFDSDEALRAAQDAAVTG